MKYNVLITETLTKSCLIDAESEEEALKLIEEAYYKDDIRLDANDFLDVEFEIKTE